MIVARNRDRARSRAASHTNAAGGGDWTVATNWTARRAAPSTDDPLQFTAAMVVVTNADAKHRQRALALGRRERHAAAGARGSSRSPAARARTSTCPRRTLNLNGSAALTIALARRDWARRRHINVSNAAHPTALDGGALVFVGGSGPDRHGVQQGIFGNGGATKRGELRGHAGRLAPALAQAAATTSVRHRHCPTRACCSGTAVPLPRGRQPGA